MGVIDIGNPATARADNIGSRTVVAQDNPAGASGVIDKVEIYAAQDLSDLTVGIFYVVSGNNLSTRDYVYIGAVAAWDKRSFDVDLEIESGDYIGAWIGSGGIKADFEGVGIWASDLFDEFIPCTNQLFNNFGSWCISLRGLGESADVASSAIFMGTDF